MKDIKVEIINQLSDNYSYILFNNSNSSSIVVDPSEDKKEDINKKLRMLIKEMCLMPEYYLS